MARPIGIEELNKSTFWNQMNKVWTATPCVVVNIHNNFEEQLVDVQPCVNMLLQDGRVFPHTVIYSVPVVMPATSTSALTFPISIGDNVLCVFSQEAIEVFQESDGRPSTPDNFARFHKKDAMAIVGLFPRQLAINNPNKRTHTHSTSDLVIAHNIGTGSEVEIRCKPNGDIIVNSPTKVEINCNTAEVTASTSISIDSPTTNWNGDINITGDINQTGTLTASVDVLAAGKSLATHVHGGVSSGLSSTNPPT